MVEKRDVGGKEKVVKFVVDLKAVFLSYGNRKAFTKRGRGRGRSRSSRRRRRRRRRREVASIKIHLRKRE